MKSILKNILPNLIWKLLQRSNQAIPQSLKRKAITLLRRFCNFFNLDITRKNDYYSPLPDITKLKINKSRWYHPSSLEGINYNLDEFQERLLTLIEKYFSDFSQLPVYEEIIKTGFGPGFPLIDAFFLYLLVRERKPKIYIEIGSGVSTYYCNLAIKDNRKQGNPCKIYCIEPNPYQALANIPEVKIIKDQVQDIDISFFYKLHKNDILLVDSSHMLKIDSDVAYLILEVLPKLNNEVLIHFHDINFPYNIPYPPEKWIFGESKHSPLWPTFWNEAMVVQAFLCFNRKYKIIMSLPLLRYYNDEFLKKNLPFYKKHESFSSLWLQVKEK